MLKQALHRRRVRLVDALQEASGIDVMAHPTADALRQAFAKNPYMRVYIGSGYYDLATPFFATEYTFSHMGLPAKYKSQITSKMFQAGHMFYVYKPALAELSKDIEAFVTKK